MRLGMGRKKIRIGDILVAAGAITEEQLQEALAYQKENGGKLGNVLVDLGMISNEILITLLTQQLGIDYIELKGAKIEEKVLHLVPENMVAKYKVIPIEIDPDNPNYRQLLNRLQNNGQYYQDYSGNYNSSCCICDDCCTSYLCCSCLTPWGGMCC